MAIYKLLAKAYTEGRISFEHVVTFNMVSMASTTGPRPIQAMAC